MEIEADDRAAVVRRLKRAQGQIGGVIAMLEAGRDCRDVVTQVAAASKALDRAGFAIIAGGLQQCLLEDTDDPNRQLNLAQMEKLFLSLA